MGGHVDASFRRVAQHGDGWIAGGLPPDAVKGMIDAVRAAWKAAGREGAPRTVGLAYFSLGPDASGEGRSWPRTRSVAAGARRAPVPSATSNAIMNLFVFCSCSASVTARGL